TSNEFRPEAYEDEVRKRIEGVIQKKVEGQEVSLAPPEAAGAQIIDPMEALKASLQGGAAAASPAAAATPSPAPAAEERKPAKRAPRRAAEEVKASSKK